MLEFLKKKKKDDISARLHGKMIKYVTERTDNEETVIGKSGSLSVRDGELIVLSSSEIVFRGVIKELKLSELLSGDGLVIFGNDTEHDCRERSIVVYYTYYL